MRFRVSAALLVGIGLSARLMGQQPPPPPAESTSAESAPPVPPPPSPAQTRYLQGLRTAGRGVAQIKDGISRLVRAETGHDTVQVHAAARRLGGLCTAARGFLVSGRGSMEPASYEPPTRKPARDLALQLDSLSIIAKECQLTASKSPGPVATGLLARLRAYETALAAFRTAIGLPNR
jgi:hypothetical protein